MNLTESAQKGGSSYSCCGTFLLKDTSIRENKSVPDITDAKKRKRDKRKRIRCPACGWQPDGKPYWQCELCLTIFDTFKTRAHCPNPPCDNSWELTQCIRCGVLSPHDEWYARKDD